MDITKIVVTVKPASAVSSKWFSVYYNDSWGGSATVISNSDSNVTEKTATISDTDFLSNIKTNGLYAATDATDVTFTVDVEITYTE